MTIDPTNEQLITFKALAERLPRRRRNRPVSISSIFRWRQRGIKGIRLDAIRIGGAWHTSLEAFKRFTAALTAASESDDSNLTGTERVKNRNYIDADSQLEEKRW